jgi:hypothetical protein
MFTRFLRQPVARIARVTGSRPFSSGGGGKFTAAMPVSILALAGASYCYYDMTDQDDMKEQTEALEKKVGEIQVDLSGKTNSAFVFIKPHACKGKTGAVEKVVEDKFKASGIRVTGKGEISAEDIDKKMYIDTHYGAIASKAVKLKPAELNVPDKGKAAFEKVSIRMLQLLQNIYQVCSSLPKDVWRVMGRCNYFQQSLQRERCRRNAWCRCFWYQ